VERHEVSRRGNRKKVTDPDGVETSYEYDALDRLVTATMPGGAATYRYWPDGLERSRSLPNRVEEGRCYDAAGRLAAVVTAHGAVADDCTTGAALVSRFDYGYDGDGNRARQLERRTSPATQALGATEETSYGHDDLDRLVGVLYPAGQALLYRLDGVGNRIGERELEGQGPGSTSARSTGWIRRRSSATSARRSTGRTG